jgi:type VI secretion system protein ImpF
MQRFTPYLLDRLFQDTSHDRRDGYRASLTLEQVKDSVAADVEALLNTRCAVREHELAPYRYAKQSILRFGLDDFSARSLASVADRDYICRAIERAIADQEPRLTSVRVDIDANESAGQQLRFSIRALLQLHPTTEPVNFDAVLQTGTQQYQVSSGGRVGAGG